MKIKTLVTALAIAFAANGAMANCIPAEEDCDRPSLPTNQVPEPGTLALLALGLAGLAYSRRKR